MKTLMRTNNDGRFQQENIIVETHLSKTDWGYDCSVTIEKNGNYNNTEYFTEYMIADTKKEAQKEVTRIARKYCNQ